MQFLERSFSTDQFRPKPEVRVEENDGLILIATPWGERDAATSTINLMSDYLLAATRDPEATTPFPRLESISENANNLRIAAMLAHDALINGTNKEEFLSGVEIFAAIANEQEVVWVQCGYPQVLLLRADKPAFPIITDLDLSVTMSPPGQLLAALPERLVGIDRDPPLHVNSIKRLSGDGLALVSRSHLPTSLFDVTGDEMDLEVLAKHCVDENSEIPFWAAIWRP